MSKTILVLGGGGMKGMVHIGAWKAIQDAGIEVAEIVGTSIGALVGACMAAGQGWAELAPLALALAKEDIVTMNRWAVLPNGIRQKSVFDGARFQAYIDDVLPAERFDELAVPLQVNAVDIENGRTVWFGEGGRMDVPLAEAVYASCALPVFWPPAEIDGEFLVDGGVTNALPIERAAERGADRIIAVDASAGEESDPLDTVSKGMIAIHHRVLGIANYARRQEKIEGWDGPELIYVRPPVEEYSTFDFGRTKYFLEEGYHSTRDALTAAFPDQHPSPEEVAAGAAEAGKLEE